jgi:hypothetical protein
MRALLVATESCSSYVLYQIVPLWMQCTMNAGDIKLYKQLGHVGNKLLTGVRAQVRHMALVVDCFLLFPIQILSSSKVLSEDIAAKQEIASATELEIDKVGKTSHPLKFSQRTLLPNRRLPQLQN